jgi:CMP-N,N'-diacetyllegionaminic acid synthase
MNALGVVLVRGGSKGVPDKHLRWIGGKPLLQWTLEAMKACSLLDDYVLSSNDPKLLVLADAMEIDTINRPGYLAQDDTPTLPALIHAVDIMERRHSIRYDYIVEIRATSPFKTTEDITEMVKLLHSSGADSVIGVSPLEDHHPARIKWLDDDGYIRNFLPEPQSGRRQDLVPKAYIRNGTVYALRREQVMGETPQLFGHEKSLAYVMPRERSINIDEEIDLQLAQVIAERIF